MLRLARLEGPKLGASHRATVRTSQLEPDSIPLAVYSHSKPIEGISAKATPTKHSVALSHSSNAHAHAHSKPDQRERGVTDPKPSREPLRVSQPPGSCPDTSREGGTPDEKVGGGEGPPSRHGHGTQLPRHVTEGGKPRMEKPEVTKDLRADTATGSGGANRAGRT